MYIITSYLSLSIYMYIYVYKLTNISQLEAPPWLTSTLQTLKSVRATGSA